MGPTLSKNRTAELAAAELHLGYSLGNPRAPQTNVYTVPQLTRHRIKNDWEVRPFYRLDRSYGFPTQ